MKIIITENKFKKVLKLSLKTNGVKNTIDNVGGWENFCKVLNIEGPMDFLHLFDDLEQVPSEEKDYWLLFRNKRGDNYFIYHKKTNEVSVKYDIWRILEDKFDESYMRVQLITQRWVENVYDLNQVITRIMDADSEKMI